MLKGTLDDFTLPDMFRLMSLAKKTGRMDVVRQAGTGKVFFHEGEVYYAESSLSKEPLGRKLVRSRALNESQLNKALDLHAQTGERVGSILVNSGMVTAEQIETAVQQQIEDAIFDLLRWDLGEFTWEDGAELAVEVPIGVSVENLIMEASRRLDELEVIKRKIPSVHAVLTMAPAPPEGAAEINITPDEWRVLVLVDGSRTVEAIGVMSGLDEFETMRMLYGLVSAGLIELDPDATEAAIEAAAAGDEDLSEDDYEVEAPMGEAAAEPVEGTDVEVEPSAAPEADVEPAAQIDAVVEVEPAVEAEAEPTSEAEAEPTSEAEAEPTSEAEAEVVDEVGVEAQAEVEAVEAVEGVRHQAEPASPLDSVLAEYGMDATVDTSPNGTPAAEELQMLLHDSADAPVADVAVDAVAIAPEYQDVHDEDPAVAADAEPAPETEPTAAADGPPAEWFEDPGTVDGATVDEEGDDPFLSDLLHEPVEEVAVADDGLPEHDEPAAEAPAPPPAEAPPAPRPAADAPSVDRAAVVRELAGLFDEERPRPKASPAGSQRPKPADPNDQKKRVEDDDQINKGLVSRLIKGVKGL